MCINVKCNRKCKIKCNLQLSWSGHVCYKTRMCECYESSTNRPIIFNKRLNRWLMLIQLYFLLASFFKRGKGRHVSCVCSFFSINSKVKDLQHDFNVMWFQSSSALIMCLQNIFKDEVEQTKIKPASLLLDAIFCFFLK